MERFMIVVADPVKAMLIKIWSYVPTVAGVIIILVVGWLIAKLIELIVVRILKALKIDALSDKAGITKVLSSGDINKSVTEIVGAIVYWLLILVVIATVLNALNLTVAADILSRLVAYIPNILIAIFILVLGGYLANFVAVIVRASAMNAGIKNSGMLAQVTRITLVIFAALMAIEQLGIGVAVINLAISLTLASLGLGFAIAFGLGCKDMVGKAVSGIVDRMKK